MKTKLILTACSTVAMVMTCAAGETDVQQIGNAINARLAQLGANVRLAKLEAYGVSGASGQTVFFNDRAFSIGLDYVPRDSRREWSGDQSQWLDDITYAIDGVENQTHNALNAIPAIRRAMTTWDDVETTTIPLTDLGDAPFDLGFAQFLTTMVPNIFGDPAPPFPVSGFPAPVADITHAGFLSAEWFEYVFGPGAGAGVLGVTLVFNFHDDLTGLDTDINGDGQLDTAFSEVYYNNNPAFNWAIDGVWVLGSSVPRDIDIQTVALHESGHALSQNHFGKAFRTKNGGPVYFAPFAVMNAAYSRVQQTLTGSDIAGHSQIWASWPNN